MRGRVYCVLSTEQMHKTLITIMMMKRNSIMFLNLCIAEKDMWWC